MKTKVSLLRMLCGCSFKLEKILEFTGEKNRNLQKALVSRIYKSTAELSANRELNNKYAGRRAFVIGNGPSLSRLPLDLLKDELTFGLNTFYKHPIINSWHPTFYCINDPVFFVVDGVVGKANHHLAEIEKLTLSSLFLISQIGAESLRIGQLASSKTLLINFFGNCDEGLMFWPRFDAPLPASLNIAQSAIIYAMAMGCSEIYLLGCDHKYNNDGSWGHFYEDGKSSRGFVCRGFSESLHGYIFRLMKSYRIIDDFARKKGVKILNATDGSAIDVFERVKFEDLF